MKPSLPNLRHGETYTDWAKRRLQESFIENVSLFDAVIAPLIGYAIDLEVEMQQRSADRARELNRRVDVENALLEFAAGKREHFTPEEAKAMAHKLGVPPVEPKEQLKLPLVKCTHKTWYNYTSTFSAPTRCPDCGKQMRMPRLWETNEE